MSTHAVDGAQAGKLALELVWSDGIDSELREIKLRWADDVAVAPMSDAAKALVPALTRYVAGEEPQWPELDFDFEAMPPFHGKVLQTLQREVGYGHTVTYGQLSHMAGSPRGFRAVGQAMAKNPWPLLVPCHRVLGSGGKLHGFSGAGLSMKEYLLRLEGAI